MKPDAAGKVSITEFADAKQVQVRRFIVERMRERLQVGELNSPTHMTPDDWEVAFQRWIEDNPVSLF